ncbi:RNA polymerase subunit sigma-70 [Streptomyces tateyamensis]|uniref:RNA polymerase subunit sigma-70 n=1 Tax=Streptomyces tateyamensis TaxID=565073 RepID=A0A2V4NPT3_9ACTN|nr:CAP domain-containing protein [Streptomyces tateyamensis]PYC87638.1 RNA polymerase subunit sigma-70 [Streptomyces tateyamensis]
MTEYPTEELTERYVPSPPERRAGGGAHRKAGNGRHRHRARRGSTVKPLFAVVAVAATATAAVVGGKALFAGPQDGRAAAAPEPPLPAGDVPVGDQGAGAGSAAPSRSAAPSAVAASPSAPTSSGAAPSAGPTRLPGAAVVTTPVQHPTTAAARPGAPASSPLTAVPSRGPSGSSGSSAGAGSGADLNAAANQVLAVINQARAAQGVAPLQMLAGLQTSADAHNHTMAGGCGLSHQCPGEAAFGDREHAAGVQWGTAGENIGDGGPVADTTDAAAKMAVGLTNSMLAEQPPNDGHRRNILNPDFHHIGIELLRDSSGTLWMTQDFSD